MAESPLIVTQQFGNQVAVSGAAGQMTYRHGGLPKACLHPLTTPAGHRLSGFQMSDHLWHRGLWFAIKFINGTNFWEEHEPFGVQIHTCEPVVELLSETSARVNAQVDWTSAATGVVFKESRTISQHQIAADTAAVDWSCTLHAMADLTLDRTPYTTWGGYGGLILRTTREFHKAQLLLPNGEQAQGLAGQTADWVVMNGLMDNGPNVKTAFAFIDHPANPRSPSAWYAKTGPEVNFINAAFLFAEPMEVTKGSTLTFNYSVLLKDGHWTTDEFKPLADAFRATTPEIA